MTVKVLIAHDEDEEAKAQALAGPIREAGYEVVHGGTVLVGESVPGEYSKLLAAGMPVVLCGTVLAIGSGWARRLAMATRSHAGTRLFIVQVEKKADVDSIALDGEKIARYWQDPNQAAQDLLAALHKFFPLPGVNKTIIQPRSPLHQLPSPPEHFTGRAESLAQVCATLRQGGTVAVSAVNGLGGIGKTALAIMAAHAVRADFPDMQLFIELRAHSPNPVTAAAARDSVLQAAHPEARLPDNEATRWMLYRALFDGKRALVVLDDAAEDAQVEALKPPLGSALLVTSRRQLWAGASLRLDKLPRAEAVDLLRTWAPRLTAAEAERLAVLCGDLPVALKTAGGYLKAYRAKPVAEYLAALEANRLQRLKNPDQPADDVNVIFEASYRALTEPERGAWAALAIMSADFGREAGKAVIAAADAGDLLDRLVNLNLLEYGEESGRFGWHDLLREFAAARLSAEAGERARVAHADYFIGIGERTDELYMQGNDSMLQGLALFDQERAQLEAAFAFLADAPRHDARLLKLVGGVVYTGALRLTPFQRICWLEAQADAARRLGDKPQEGNALGNLGVSYRHLGEPHKAIECLKQRLSIAREIGDRRGEGTALCNLGNTYSDLGKFRAAIQYFEQALVIAHKISDRHLESSLQGNLGIVYRKLCEPHKAIKCHKQHLAIARHIGDRLGESNALNNLGRTYADLGKQIKAIKYYELAIVVTRNIGDRRGEGITLNNLGVAYRNMGKLRKAIECHEQHLIIARQISDRRGQSHALGNLGNDYLHFDEIRKAIECQEQSLAIVREIGNRHGEGADLGNLGLAYFCLGEPRKAIEYHEQHLAIAREIGDRRGEGNALCNSAAAYKYLGERAEAILRAEQALAIFEAIENPNATQLRAQLAEWRAEPGPGSE